MASATRTHWLAVCALGAMGAAGPALTLSGETFPGSTWIRKPPSQVGLDAFRLVAFKTYVGGRGMVVRHGFLAYSWGDVTQRDEIASAGKPIHTHLLLNAVHQGLIASFDEPVMKFEPRLETLNKSLGHKDRGIKWRHLANMTSGYGLTEPPGAAFAYNDFATALYFDTLVNRVYGTPWPEADERVLMRVLGSRIGWQDRPTFARDKRGRVHISLRDHARFGWLYRHRGEWNGTQLLPPELVDLAVDTPVPVTLPQSKGFDAEMIADQRTSGGGKNQQHHFGSYSFTWWTNGILRNGSHLWPALPDDAYAARGHRGESLLLVVPSLDLVVVWNDSRVVRSLEKQRHAFALLMRSVR